MGGNHISGESPRRIGPGEAGARLDVFLAGWIGGFSRARLQAFIRSGHVLVNLAPSRPSYGLRDGDLVSVDFPAESTPPEAPAQDIPLDVLHEDDSVLVINKPAGLVVHPGAGNPDGTVVNALLHHHAPIRVVGGRDRPGIVHRLDKETSGCLVIAKSEPAHLALTGSFARREVHKTYLAIASGIPRLRSGTINAPIARHPVHRQKMTVSDRGRPAETLFRVLGTHGGNALVECQPVTGRTHQIRVHLRHWGHPVAGDPLYGRRDGLPRHLLHAWKIDFPHPEAQARIAVTAPVPEDFPEWARLLVQAGDKKG